MCFTRSVSRETPGKAMSTHYATCPLCEATCGLAVQLHDGEIKRIEGDERDTFSRGFICPKGASLAQLHNDPDRLKTPLLREPGGAFRPVTWDEAFAHIEARLLPGIGKDRRAAAIYLGNPNVHSPAGVLLPRRLIRALGTPNVFSASTVDQMPKHVACGLMYGDPEAISVPDLDRTDFLLMLGANPWESNGSLCTAPDFPGRIQDLLRRGGRFVVVDPRRTRTAEHASEHVAIRPGTDIYLMLGLMHVVARDGLSRLGPLAGHVEGLADALDAARPYTPARVAAITGVPADVVERLARELAAAERGVVYGRMGTHTVSFGTLGAWAVDTLNAITGHLDSVGGAMWALPAHMSAPDLNAGKERRGFRLGRWKSRVHGYPEANGELPIATLADEITTPGEGQVRVLVTVAGNPVLSAPDSTRLDSALAQLDFMVSVDPYLNETTRHAHVILPPPSPLTRSHYDLALSRLSVRNRARYSPPLFAPQGPSEAEIMARLTLIASGAPSTESPQRLFAEMEQQLLEGARGKHPALKAASVDALRAQLDATDPMDRLIEILVRSGAYGDAFGQLADGLNFKLLQDSPHGVDLGPLKPCLPGAMRTPSGRVELMPEPIRTDLARLLRTLDDPHIAAPYVLVGRRDLRSNNSWMHNLPLLMKGRARCTLHVHPADAENLGITQGDDVRIQTDLGSVVAPAEITDKIMQGVVSLPHGYGHDRPGTQQRVAGKQPGVNVNLLTDARALDPLSGNAVLNGYAVRLEVLRPAAEA
jgi:anaerobic selenocysteine-containing dehydrogenase